MRFDPLRQVLNSISFERERERERDRQTDRQTDRQRERALKHRGKLLTWLKVTRVNCDLYALQLWLLL